jgi:hypothetical protein
MCLSLFHYKTMRTDHILKLRHLYFGQIPQAAYRMSSRIEMALGLGAAKYLIKAKYFPRDLIIEFREILGLPMHPISKPEVHPIEPDSHMPTYTDMPPDDEINKKSTGIPANG